MSGIVAIHNLDGRPVERIELNACHASLAHRGGDADQTWCCGVVGLSNQRLAAETGTEKDAAIHVSHTGLVVSGDMRLDNAEELRRELGLEAEATDAKVVAAAYQRWGSECPSRLYGDFAFTLWAPRERRLFCACDPFGAKPLFFCARAGRVLVVASEIKAIFAHPLLPKRVDSFSVADYLAEISSEPDRTFYEGVFRLPGGHWLSCDGQRWQVRQYWRLAPADDAPRDTGDVVQRFCWLLQRAVERRLPERGSVGCLLSGGLDSSSITALGAPLMRGRGGCWHAFSGSYQHWPECDEAEYLNALTQHVAGINTHRVRADGQGPITCLEQMVAEQDEPPWEINTYIPRQLYRAAAARGVRVVLDGYDGDSVVGHGASRLTELLLSGRLLEFLRQGRRLTENLGVSPLRILRRFVLAPLLPHALWSAWQWSQSRWPFGGSLVETRLARQIDLCARRAQFFSPRPSMQRTANGAHRLRFDKTRLSRGLRTLDIIAGSSSVIPRHPFLDPELVAFCMGLPADQKFDDGWTRVVLRRSMAGRIPERIRWRGKVLFGAPVVGGLACHDGAKLQRTIDESTPLIKPFVRQSTLRKVRSRFDSRPGLSDAVALYRVAALGVWLRSLVGR